jgi:DNA ligase-1
VTGALRTAYRRGSPDAVAALGNLDPDDIEIVWPNLKPPYGDLFAWVEGRAARPASGDPAPFRPPMLSHAIEEADFAALDPAAFLAEWKWDGIRVQATGGRRPDASRIARLFSRTGEDISATFRPCGCDRVHGALDGGS